MRMTRTAVLACFLAASFLLAPCTLAAPSQPAPDLSGWLGGLWESFLALVAGPESEPSAVPDEAEAEEVDDSLAECEACVNSNAETGPYVDPSG